MKKLEPRAGRLAFICEKKHEGRDVMLRVFVSADQPPPKCPEHGKMSVQKNNAYFGQPIPAV